MSEYSAKRPPPIDIDLSLAVEVADELIARVRETEEFGGRLGDHSELYVLGAFRRCFTRLIWVRNAAAEGAGLEAIVLTRSLLNIVIRAIWVNQPTELQERNARYQRLIRREVEDLLGDLKLRKEHGFSIADSEIEAFETLRDGLEPNVPKGLPRERGFFEEVGLMKFYARIYVRASNLAHFSMTSAVGDLVGEHRMPLELRDDPLAAEALALAIIAFGQLVESARTVIGDDLNTSAVAITRRLFSRS